jgi:hypothetical protein
VDKLSGWDVEDDGLRQAFGGWGAVSSGDGGGLVRVEAWGLKCQSVRRDESALLLTFIRLHHNIHALSFHRYITMLDV